MQEHETKQQVPRRRKVRLCWTRGVTLTAEDGQDPPPKRREGQARDGELHGSRKMTLHEKG